MYYPMMPPAPVSARVYRGSGPVWVGGSGPVWVGSNGQPTSTGGTTGLAPGEWTPQQARHRRV